MISAEVQRTVSTWGPAFRLPLEALSAIEAQHGRARMLDHALAAPDENMRFMALLLEDAKLAINLMTDLVRAQQSPSRVKRIQRRLVKALAAAKLRVEALTLEMGAAPCRHDELAAPQQGDALGDT